MAMFGGGGFGGDAGNQFAGGGFMPSQANDGFGGGGSGGRSRGDKSNSTLRTLTIRQLALGVNNTDEEVYRVDGVELQNVTVMGKIVNVRDSNMTLTITITDGTGQMEIDHWINEDSEFTAASKKAEWRPGVYIRAFGHLRRNQQTRSLNLQAFNMRTITNFNEVTYHFLRCIFEHLHITKGGAGAAPAMGGAAAGIGLAAPAGGGWQAGGQGGAATAYAGAAAGGVDSCSGAVLQVIQACNSDQGLHVGEIYNKLNGRFNQQAINQALQSLTAEAHLYTTTDDDHYKAA